MLNNIAITQTAVIAGIGAVIVAISTYWLQNRKKNTIPTKWKAVGKVGKLFMYPLKSGRRLELEQAECTRFGLKEVEKFDKSYQLRDRALVVYTENEGEFRTARTYPKMILIEVSSQDINCITLNAPGMKPVTVKIPDGKNSIISKVKQHKGEEIITIDCGDEVAVWLSQYIVNKDKYLRLGYHNTSKTRDIREKYAKEISHYKNLSNDATGLYSDLTSMHLINQSSVLDLNERMGDSSITYKNFRPTLLMDGLNLKPYAEEQFDWVKVGDVVMRNAIECTRCMMTTIDPETGIRRTDRQPLKTLEGYKMSTGPSKSPVMGIQLGVYQTGVISVGDLVYVEDTA